MSVYVLLLVLVSLLHNATAQEDPEQSIGEQLESLIREMGDYLIWLFGFATEEAGTGADKHATQEFTDHILHDIDAMLQDVKLIENEIQKVEEGKERAKQGETENKEQEVSTQQDQEESQTNPVFEESKKRDSDEELPKSLENTPETPFGNSTEQYQTPDMPVIPIEQ